LKSGSINQTDQLLTAGLFFLTAFAFAPTILWLFEQTLFAEQLKHSLIVLGFAGTYLMMEKRERLELVLHFDNRSTWLLLGGLGLLIGASFSGWVLLSLPAFCMALAGWLIFLFGRRLSRALLALLSAFIGYVFFALTLPVLDWPLRTLAGQSAAALLERMGKSVDLGLTATREPKLLLEVEGRFFEVAAECNGFGMLSSCILLALLLVFYRKISWLDKVLAVVLAGFLAGVGNLGRILVICLLAPLAGDHYWVMHEVVGNVFFLGSLALTWWMTRGLEPSQSTDARQGHSLILFDGECAMCNRSMRALLRADTQGVLRCAPLSGTTASEVFSRHPHLHENMGTMVLIEGFGSSREKVSLRSSAVLRAACHLPGWRLAARLALLVPTPIRDGFYRFVARNRFRWFGKVDNCSLIPPERRHQLLP